MPMYEYVCKHCSVRQELMLPVDSRDTPTVSSCPRCGEFEVVRVPSLVSGWRLKGDGWTRDGSAWRKNPEF